jgi:hypothetical protein
MQRRRMGVAIGVAALLAAVSAGPAQAGKKPGNVIRNGTFSHGLRGWRKTVIKHGEFSSYPQITASTNVHCFAKQIGNPFLQIDVPGGANGYVQQSFKVPRHPGRLTFTTWGNLEPVSATVSIVAGHTIKTLLSFTPPTLQGNSASGCSGKKPLRKSFKVGHWAGKRIALRFQATSTGTDGTIADFDNVTLR